MFLKIHLTEESCNLIVAALRELPHKLVHELVVDISTQVKTQNDLAECDKVVD
jgi:hypothetical protein